MPNVWNGPTVQMFELVSSWPNNSSDPIWTFPFGSQLCVGGWFATFQKPQYQIPDLELPILHTPIIEADDLVLVLCHVVQGLVPLFVYQIQLLPSPMLISFLAESQHPQIRYADL